MPSRKPKPRLDIRQLSLLPLAPPKPLTTTAPLPNTLRPPPPEPAANTPPTNPTETSVPTPEPVQESPDNSLPPNTAPQALWPHQQRALRFLADKPAAMLAMEMGTGKTRVALEYLQRNQCARALILCPLSVVPHVWPQEAQLYLGNRATATALTANGNAAKLKQLVRAESQAPEPTPDQPHLVVLNYEAAWRGNLAEALLGRRWDLLILDESHRVKSPGGQASRFAAQLARRVPRRLALTGTPMPNNPLDLWAQFRVLDPHIFPATYREFEHTYARLLPLQHPRRGFQVIGFKNQDDLQRRFKTLAFQVSSQETLDLPAARHTNRLVTMSPEARRVYAEMRAEFTAKLSAAEAATAANAAAMVNKLQQIASGFVIDEARQTIDLDTAKEKALTDFLLDLPTTEPVVVFARFRRNLESIAAAAATAGRACRELSGSCKQLDQWQRDPDGSVLAVQLQAGGLGIDLTKARHCVYFTLDYNLGNFQQSLARLRRPGQNSSVNYLYLTAAETIDENILNALRSKEDLIKSITASQALPGRPPDPSQPPPL